VISTVEAVEKGLVDNGFVLRYRTADDGAIDGLTGREGAFLACSFWLVDCLHMIGRTKDAEKLFKRLLGLRNDLGLLSEEYDAIGGRLVGNFPQAFSHVSLVNSACRLTGHDALAIGPDEPTRRRRIVDHTASLLPTLSRTPKRKRPQVAKRRSAATG
jgi:GH15 family glucan-1,4-alpha-glucosidase